MRFFWPKGGLFGSQEERSRDRDFLSAQGAQETMKPVPRSATLVVIEFSAAWPRWLKPSGSDMAVVAQHYEGHPSSLVTQVASRTTRLEVVGWRLDTLVLVSNGRTDPDAVAARAILARGLAARMRARGRGGLLLAVDEKCGQRAGAHLRDLAASLHQTLVGSPVELGVRVGDRIWGSTAGAGKHMAQVAEEPQLAAQA